MQFCEKCDNLTSLKSNEEQTMLFAECLQCGFSVSVPNDENQYVFRKQYTKRSADPQTFINQFTAFDPTLPRLRNKTCINNDCLSKAGHLWKTSGLNVSEVATLLGKPVDSLDVRKKWSETEWLLHLPTETNSFPVDSKHITRFEGEVVYIKYDDQNMKYLYICTTCNKAWKND